MKNIQIC